MLCIVILTVICAREAWVGNPWSAAECLKHHIDSAANLLVLGDNLMITAHVRYMYNKACCLYREDVALHHLDFSQIFTDLNALLWNKI